MMQFKEQKSIYLQIAERLEERVLKGGWKNSERIPSIRETAIEMEVNPNTIMRTYAYLQEKEVIFNKRGIGYFTASDAKEKILEERKQQFLQEMLPDLFRNMVTLNISPDEIIKHYADFTKEINHENE